MVSVLNDDGGAGADDFESDLGHTPVLVREVLENLRIGPGQIVVDTTIGLAGHARLFAEAVGDQGRLVGIDADPANLAIARQRLEGVSCGVDLIHGNFAELPELLGNLGLAQVDVLFADLGVSSTHLDDGSRGFSFRYDGPLDMRIDPRLTTTAADLVNRLSDKELGDVLYFNAQETRARRIAKAICEARRQRRIITTRQLASLVSEAQGVRNEFSRRSKTHPATRTFLALRMAVNSEMANLRALLVSAPALLKPGGRIGVIAFHSVEDKEVKTDFRRRKSEDVYDNVTPKPIVAGADERARNPRSRSAKLRVAAKRIAA